MRDRVLIVVELGNPIQLTFLFIKVFPKFIHKNVREKYNKIKYMDSFSGIKRLFYHYIFGDGMGVYTTKYLNLELLSGERDKEYAN